MEKAREHSSVHFSMFILILIILCSATLWAFLYFLWRLKFKKSARIATPILAYHQITDSFDLSITRQKVSQFERGIIFLHEQGYRSVALKDVFAQDDKHDDPNWDITKKKVALTFDDGYEDFFLNAFPILQRYGFTACIFVTTGYVGKESNWDYGIRGFRKRHLSWKQIQELSDAGFSFGSHTVNHPDLTKIPKQLVDYELKASKEILEDKLGQRVDFLSYPFGRYNRYAQHEAEKAGYQGAYTLCPDAKTSGFDPLAQKRWGVYLFDSPLTLKIKLNKEKLSWIEDMKNRIINRFSGWTIILKGLPNYDQLDIKP